VPVLLDVLVVGAGISGLVAAFRLHRGGRRVAVVEAATRAGGVIGSRRREGFLYEAGPNSALDTTPLIGALLRDAGVAEERREASAVAAKRFVVREGRPMALPTSPAAFLATRVFSLRAKLRLAREPFIRRAPPETDETVAAFVRRRLGDEFLDYAIEPFVAGVYAGDPERLSVRAAFPRLHALEQRYGSLIRGQVLGARERGRSRDRAKNVASSFSFRSGMQTLPDVLARALPALELGVRATRVDRIEGGFRVTGEQAGVPRSWQARAVLVATPAEAAAGLLRDLAPAASSALGAIPYAPVASVATAYARADVAHPLDGFGFLAPRKEDRPILGTLFSSSMFEERAPEGAVLLTSFVGGERDPALACAAPARIAAIVARELRDLLGAGTPLWQEVVQWPRAIPQYTVGHLDRMAVVERAEREIPGLYLRANYRDGVSVGDCIKSASATADAVGAFLDGQVALSPSSPA
jgi:oxygen-dependent protoporphyrinogen oxidase